MARLVYGVASPGVSTELPPHLLASPAGGGAGGQGGGPPHEGLLLAGGPVTPTHPAHVQHVTRADPQVTAHTVTLARHTDSQGPADMSHVTQLLLVTCHTSLSCSSSCSTCSKSHHLPPTLESKLVAGCSCTKWANNFLLFHLMIRRNI